MQTIVSEPSQRTNSTGHLAVASESVAQSAAQLSAFTHKRDRKHVVLSWNFKLAAAGAISALVAMSLLIQA